MSTETEDEIVRRMSISADGSSAVYGLESGFDFSRPKEVGEALARVLWERHISGWIVERDGAVTVEPDREVEIHLPAQVDREMEKAVEVMNDVLKHEEMWKGLGAYLRGIRAPPQPSNSYLYRPVSGLIQSRGDDRVARKVELLRLYEMIVPHVKVIS